MESAQEHNIVYSHSLKLETTAKGLRIHTHVYTMDKNEAIEQAFEMYQDALSGLYSIWEHDWSGKCFENVCVTK